MKNIIYFGYDLFYPCLEYLVGRSDVNVLKVYSFASDEVYDFHDKVKGICAKNNIEFTLEKITADELKKQFEQNRCDLAFSAGYAYKIPTNCTPLFKGINVHPSLLPIGKGGWPFPHIILKGLKKSGVTVHKLTDSFDDGDILLQKEFDVTDNDTIFTLEEKSRETALLMMDKLFDELDLLFKNASKQPKGEYWQLPTESDSTIFLDTSESEKQRIIRAFGEKNVIYSDKNKGE